MASARVLIVYGSSYGQTEKIAERLRNLLTAGGCDVVLFRGDAVPEWLCLGDFDGVIVGGSVIGGNYQDYIERFARAHHAALNRLPSAFFGVSGAAGSPSAEGQAEAVRTLELFLARVGWRPRLTASFAGAMAYSRYNPFLRFVMRRMARKNGERDTRHDREYTDWSQVQDFARHFSALVRLRVPAESGQLVEV
jgi:menaquinone-dependent protoporphyrinogen oxidase